MIRMTSENVDIQPKKLDFAVALMTLDSSETSRDIDSMDLHRISIPFIWAEWFGLGNHF